jgi:lipopolysaccharide/colanic/teichoic acid biosynthesis glycosyltransferase
MRVKRQKLAIILVYEFSFFFVFCLIARELSLLFPGASRTFSAALALLLAGFFLLYFYRMWRNLYSRDFHYYLRNTYRIVLNNTILSVLVAAAASVLLKIAGVLLPSVSILLLYLAMGAAAFSARHVSQLLWVSYLSRLGYFSKKVLVLGDPEARLHWESYFPHLGGTKQYAGTVTYDQGEWIWISANSPRRRVVGYPEEVEALILKENIGGVIIFLGAQMPEDMKSQMVSRMVAYCQSLPISYSLVPQIYQVRNRRFWDRVSPYIPAVERFSGKNDSLTAISFKRLLDLAVSSLALLFLPLAMFIALAIKLEDGGPVLYRSTRIGKNGKPLRFYKFRTMIVHAEQQKKKLLPLNERPDGPLFKMAKDPRVTKVGKVLRKHNFDELPQLLNVWLGNLSLVGPRPHLPEEVADYRGKDYLRLECMPGIVGLPQLVGRKMIGFREWVELDLKYRQNWSLQLDLRILSKAVKITLATFARNRRSRG